MNDRDFTDIDRHLQACMDKGYAARLSGATKYDNDYDPGSLSFDAWQAGFNLPAKDGEGKEEESKTAMQFIKEQEPSCYGDIELLMKDYARQSLIHLQQECAKHCDKSSHPCLEILQINIEKSLF